MATDIASIVGAPRVDIIEGRKLAPFRAEMFGTVSAYFQRKAVKEFSLTVAELRKEKQFEAANAVLELIDIKTRNGDWTWDKPGFRAMAFDVSNLPFLLWVSLQVSEPKITIHEATALLTPDTEDDVHRGVLELMRYKFRTPSGNPTKAPSQASNTSEGGETEAEKDSTGQPSSSESAKS
jgi:hypothetical protein